MGHSETWAARERNDKEMLKKVNNKNKIIRGFR